MTEDQMTPEAPAAEPKPETPAEATTEETKQSSPAQDAETNKDGGETK